MEQVFFLFLAFAWLTTIIRFTTTLTLWVNNCYYQWIFYEFPSMNGNGLSSRKWSCSKLLASSVEGKIQWFVNIITSNKNRYSFRFFVVGLKVFCGNKVWPALTLNMFLYRLVFSISLPLPLSRTQMIERTFPTARHIVLDSRYICKIRQGIRVFGIASDHRHGKNRNRNSVIDFECISLASVLPWNVSLCQVPDSFPIRR